MVEFVDETEATPVAAAPVEAGRAPWHLWAVGILSLGWNLIGVTDYTLTQLGNPIWISAAADNMGITADEMIAYVDSFPVWLHAFWALGVWGAVLGSILLLLRKRLAVWSFGVSLLGLAVTQLYRVFTPQPAWMDKDLALNLMLWSIATFLVIYAGSMRNKGVLR